ncbi:HD domain-containing protein [Rhodobacteraceae bacterium M382]|nr:HD domain-containing protein [Rhodobacteraceae bacterium M382]
MHDIHARLRRLVAQQMDQDPAHDLAHLDRVWTNAHRIARHQADHEDSVNLRVLMAAAYLHDLVNLPKDAPNRAEASTLSAQRAVPILQDLGYTGAEIKAAQHAIAAHSYSAGIPAQSTEAEILRDADRLDALGAIGIARTFIVAGSMKRAIYDPADPFAADRPLDDQDWSIDHWHLKLLQLPKEMVTTKGREIAEKRAKLMLAYLEQLSKEIDTDLPNHWSDLLT